MCHEPKIQVEAVLMCAELGYQSLLSDSALSCVLRQRRIAEQKLIAKSVSIYALFVNPILHSPDEGAVLRKKKRHSPDEGVAVQKLVIPNEPV